MATHTLTAKFDIIAMELDRNMEFVLIKKMDLTWLASASTKSKELSDL